MCKSGPHQWRNAHLHVNFEVTHSYSWKIVYRILDVPQPKASILRICLVNFPRKWDPKILPEMKHPVMEPFFEMPLIELHCYSRYARVHAECIFKVTLSNSEWLYLLPLNFWSNAHDYMLILSETPSRHERCTCCSEVMISQVSIPKNNLPLRTHFYQLIAKAPVECIYGCFLFHTQFSRCSGSQWILRCNSEVQRNIPWVQPGV